MSRTEENLRVIWGLSPSDLWAVGDRATVIRLVADVWMMETAPTQMNLRALSGGPDRRLWAGGDGGTLLVYR